LLLAVGKVCSLHGLREENRRLRVQLGEHVEFDHADRQFDAMREVLELVRRAAPSEASVLLTGESGPARSWSPAPSTTPATGAAQRSWRSIVRRFLLTCWKANCSATCAGLHRAVADRAGKFERAHGGTLFLDEVGELPAALPAQIAAGAAGTRDRSGRRPLQACRRADRGGDQPQYRGGPRHRPVREDLYYRLAVITVELPPLRARRDDIPLLIRHFLGKYADRSMPVSAAALAQLVRYDWPGNVRELENAVQRMIVLRRADRLEVEDLPEKIRGSKGVPAGSPLGVVQLPDEGYSLETLEREVVLQALERNGWNQSRAANFLRIPRMCCLYRMEKYGIHKP